MQVQSEAAKHSQAAQGAKAQNTSPSLDSTWCRFQQTKTPLWSSTGNKQQISSLNKFSQYTGLCTLTLQGAYHLVTTHGLRRASSGGVCRPKRLRKDCTIWINQGSGLRNGRPAIRTLENLRYLLSLWSSPKSALRSWTRNTYLRKGRLLNVSYNLQPRQLLCYSQLEQVGHVIIQDWNKQEMFSLK